MFGVQEARGGGGAGAAAPPLLPQEAEAWLVRPDGCVSAAAAPPPPRKPEARGEANRGTAARLLRSRAFSCRPGGVAMLCSRNFRVVLRYNSSVHYAMAVSRLAQQIGEEARAAQAAQQGGGEEVKRAALEQQQEVAAEGAAAGSPAVTLPRREE